MNKENELIGNLIKADGKKQHKSGGMGEGSKFSGAF